MATRFSSLATTGAMAVGGLLTAVGLTLTGNLALGGNDITGVANITLTATQSGAKLTATPVTGTAGLVIFGGAKGSHMCVFDTDAGGWTSIDALNGTVTSHIASAGECP